MKVVVKTVANATFDLEIEPAMKVSEVKAKIEDQQGAAFPKDSMTLIYRGKVLQDDKTVGEAEIAENTFMVVMIKKPTAPKAAAPPPATPAAPAAEPAATPAAPAPAPEATATPVADATPATENSAPTATPPTASPMSSILVGPELQASINAIVEMGFAKEDVERAMRAAFNNPDRAVEYLMQGIPESVAAEARPAAPAAAAPAPPAATATRTGPGGPNAAPLDLFGGGGGGGAAAAGADAGGPMAALRNNPQFAQIRAMIQQDPSSLQRMLAELSAQNPALMQLLQQNQAEFLRMLAEPAAGGAGGNPAEALQQLMAARAMEAIEMTEEDEQAISRLQEMGFPREACIEAYFSCDKQEELAANLLLEGGMMDEG